MSEDDARRLAAAKGLNKLTDKHLDQLAASIRANEQLMAGLPKDLHWSEESALVFRLPVPKEAKR